MTNVIKTIEIDNIMYDVVNNKDEGIYKDVDGEESNECNRCALNVTFCDAQCCGQGYLIKHINENS